MIVTRKTLLGIITAVSLFVATPALATECIAPANPGGGWDFTCRQVGKLLFDLGQVDNPVQVTNMSGAGGGLAFAHIVSSRQNEGDLIIAASSATTTRLAQKGYGDATASQVRWLGAIGADPGVIVVAKDSPFQNLKELIAAIKMDPTSVAFAGGSPAGGFDHLKPLQILNASGFEDVGAVSYIGSESGAEAITKTIGGFTQAMSGDMSEAIGFYKSGDIRILAVLTEERVPGFEDIPTAQEQGVDVVAVNWRGFYAPQGISDAQFEEWAGKLQTVADSKQWKDTMAFSGLAPFTKIGADFQNWIDIVIADTEMLSRKIGIIQ